MAHPPVTRRLLPGPPKDWLLEGTYIGRSLPTTPYKWCCYADSVGSSAAMASSCSEPRRLRLRATRSRRLAPFVMLAPWLCEAGGSGPSKDFSTPRRGIHSIEDTFLDPLRGTKGHFFVGCVSTNDHLFCQCGFEEVVLGIYECIGPETIGKHAIVVRLCPSPKRAF